MKDMNYLKVEIWWEIFLKVEIWAAIFPSLKVRRRFWLFTLVPLGLSVESSAICFSQVKYSEHCHCWTDNVHMTCPDIFEPIFSITLPIHLIQVIN